MKTALVTVCGTVETWPTPEEVSGHPRTPCKRSESEGRVSKLFPRGHSMGCTHAHLPEPAASGFCLARNSWS